MSLASKATFFSTSKRKTDLFIAKNESEGDEIALENLQKIKEKRNEERFYISNASNWAFAQQPGDAFDKQLR